MDSRTGTIEPRHTQSCQSEVRSPQSQNQAVRGERGQQMSRLWRSRQGLRAHLLRELQEFDAPAVVWSDILLEFLECLTTETVTVHKKQDAPSIRELDQAIYERARRERLSAR